MEEMNNKLSVITICRNCRDDLERTVQSVVAQTYANLEYIVIDGGSTDGTMQILEAYKEQIDTIISEPDDGIYDALNKGIKVASGEWIICLNAGDTFTSEHILADVFKSPIATTTSFLYSDFWLCYGNGTKQLRTTDRQQGEIHHQNAIYRKRLHEQYGYYIVTHPYIVSDLLFFLAIPANQYQKIPVPISNVKAGGISDNPWCNRQAWAARVIYGMDTIPGIFQKYLLQQFAFWRQQVWSLFRKGKTDG